MDSAIHAPRIPYDLLRPIIEHLESDRASLSVLSLASSAFRGEAQRILFRDVTAILRYTAHIKFLDTVAASPNRLALFVRTYRQCLPSVGFHSQILPDEMEDGFKAMRRLKSLEIMLLPTLVSARHDLCTTYMQMLSACTFSLERFDWVTDCSGSVEKLVEEFLTLQPTVKHIGLIHHNSLEDPLQVISSSTCPQLASVAGSWATIKAFLPRHKISTLSFSRGSSSVIEADIKPFATELNGVKALSIPFYFFRETGVLDHNFLEYFPSLNVLELYCLDVDDYEYDDDSEDQISLDAYTPVRVTEICDILSKLPTLRTLILSEPPVYQGLDENIEFMHHIFTQFGHHLKVINVEMYDSHVYARYTQFRGATRKIAEEKILKLWP